MHVLPWANVGATNPIKSLLWLFSQKHFKKQLISNFFLYDRCNVGKDKLLQFLFRYQTFYHILYPQTCQKPKFFKSNIEIFNMRTKNICTLYGAYIPNPWNFPDSMTMLRILTFTLIPSSFFSDHCVKLYG